MTPLIYQLTRQYFILFAAASHNINGILKHPGSAGSTRSKSTNRSRGGVDNKAFSDISDTPNGDFRYDNRGSYSRRSGDRLKNDYGHQNEGFKNDDSYDVDRRTSYKMANGDRGHISLADLSRDGGRTANGDYPLGRRRYGDESRTESSFNTETETSRTYSESSQDGSNSISMNPGGHYRKHERQGSIRKSRSRSQSMTSSKSGNSTRPRSNSADRASQQRSQQSSSHGSHHGGHKSHNHPPHRGSSRGSRRKKQKPPEPYLPIFDEAMKSAKNKKKQSY